MRYADAPERVRLRAGRRYLVRVPGFRHPYAVDVVRAGRGLAFRPVRGWGLMGPVSGVGRFEVLKVGR